MPHFNESTRTLGEESVMRIHERMLKESGGLPGICPDKSLVGALGRIDSYINYEGVTDLYEIAALYGIVIAQGHIFNDANKRTAMTSMLAFLAINNIILDAPEDEIPDLLVAIAEKKITLAELANWLRVNSIELIEA